MRSSQQFVDHIPQLAPGVVVCPFDNSSLHHQWLLITESGRQWKIADALQQLISLIDGRRSAKDIAHILNPEANESFQEQIAEIIWSELGGMGVIDGLEYSTSAKKRSYLTARLPLIEPRFVAILTFIPQVFFAPVLFPLLLATVTSINLYWLFHMPGRAIYGMFAYSYWWQIGLLLVLSTFIHELGHASAMRRFGMKCGEIGAGIYWIFPVLYTEVSGAWQLKRRARSTVDIAGLYFQAIATAILIVLTHRHPWPAAESVILSSILSFIPNLNPFIRMDGYWLLCDSTGVCNLQSLLGDLLRTRFDRLTEYAPKIRTLIVGYCFLSLGFIIFISVRLSTGLYRTMRFGFPALLQDVLTQIGRKAFTLSLLGQVIQMAFMCFTTVFILFAAYRVIRSAVRIVLDAMAYRLRRANAKEPIAL